MERSLLDAFNIKSPIAPNLKNVGIAASISTMRGLGFSSIWIFSALYLRTVLGLSVLEDGAVITAGTAVAALLQKFVGSFSDRVGHKKIVVSSMLFLTLLFLVIVISSYVRTSPVFYTVAFIGLTITNSAQMPSVYSIVSASSEIKTKGFSILRVGNNIGWGLGPAVGGFAIYSSGFYYLFLFGLLSSIVALIFSLMLREVKQEESPVVAPKNENTLLLLLSTVALLIFMVQAQETVTLSNYANIVRGLNYLDLGLLYLTNGMVVLATQGIVYKLIRRIGNFNSFVIGSIIYSAGFLSYAFVSDISGMLVSTIVLTIGEDFAFPSSSAMVALVSKPENIGRNMGVYNAFITSGRAIGPLIGGLVLSLTVVPIEIWTFTTLSGFLSTILFVTAFRKQAAIQEKSDVTAQSED